MKLKTKIHLYSTLLMFVILVLAMIVIYFLFQRMSYNTEYEELLNQSNELTQAMSQLSPEADSSVILRAFIPSNGVIEILDEYGESMTTVQSLAGSKITPTDKKVEDEYTLGTFDGTDTLSINVPMIWPTGEVVTLQMTKVLFDAANNLRVLTFVLAGVTIFAMIPIILSSVALGRIVTQPIEKLTHAMNVSRQSGTYEKIRGTVNGKDELAQMERTFNEMMEQLEENFTKQKEFVSNASHELKTPLTVIESYSRLLERRGVDNQAVVDEALTAVLSETNRMKDMIEQLLALAKGTEGRPLNISRVHVGKLIESAATPLRQAYERDISIEADSEWTIETDEEYVKQLLFILLDNARKYSDGNISVSVHTHETTMEIIIKDEGKGIPEADLPHIFDRFYRVDSARTRKTGGTGLGLSIAKEVADRLGATLTVESSIDIGTQFHVFLPKKINVSQ